VRPVSFIVFSRRGESEPTMHHKKMVYVNDAAIGTASSWAEAFALVKQAGVRFIGKPGAAEGPTGFYIHGRPTAAASLRTEDLKSFTN